MKFLKNLFGRKSGLDFAQKQKRQLLSQRSKWANRMSANSEEIRKAVEQIEKLEGLIDEQEDKIEKIVDAKGGNFKEFLSIQAQLNEQNATIKKLSS